MTALDRLMKPEEAAELLGVTRYFVMKRAAAGEWPHRRLGQAVRFSASDVEEIRELTKVRPAGQSEISRRRRRSA